MLHITTTIMVLWPHGRTCTFLRAAAALGQEQERLADPAVSLVQVAIRDHQALQVQEEHLDLQALQEHPDLRDRLDLQDLLEHLAPPEQQVLWWIWLKFNCPAFLQRSFWNVPPPSKSKPFFLVHETALLSMDHWKSKGMTVITSSRGLLSCGAIQCRRWIAKFQKSMMPLPLA